MFIRLLIRQTRVSVLVSWGLSLLLLLGSINGNLLVHVVCDLARDTWYKTAGRLETRVERSCMCMVMTLSAVCASPLSPSYILQCKKYML